MYAEQSIRSLGLVPADDASVIKQAAAETGFRVWAEPTDYAGLVRVFTRESGTEHEPFWAKCREIQEVD